MNCRCDSRRFPRCRLYGIPMLDSLPAGCPMVRKSALAEIANLEDRGFAEIGNRLDGDVS